MWELTPIQLAFSRHSGARLTPTTVLFGRQIGMCNVHAVVTSMYTCMYKNVNKSTQWVNEHLHMYESK